MSEELETTERVYSRAEKRKKQKAEPPVAVEIEFENPPIPEPTPQKRPRPATKTGLDKTLESNIRLLLTTAFTLTATKFGEIWAVSEEEIKSISEPTTRIMQRMGLAESTNANTDYILLLGALAIVLLPRIMLSLPKKEKKEVVKIDSTPTPTTRINEHNNKRDNKNNTENSTTKAHLLKLFE